ncbi:DNA polymerase III subunit chi [Sandaracinobacteroides saxicola]|uniref:DNA polymerase III subunit chi n=1 Tax=Sandaracinobacteroides saxicola TaxID=2759707 RepID=A0A7G5IHB3_9SPHN|nr:DNA polymerase III subunit chi [Sandaracinobacteroides saxicola]QMW22755.1 DNA polymerase III subunit chi [Sandaracinobacteroides saxicola]
MTDIGFYHCTRTPAADAALKLVVRAHASGARVLLWADEVALTAMDAALWSFDAASFVPHGRDDAARQPVLLASEPQALNGADHLISLGRGVPPGFEGFTRLFNLFEEGSDAHARARADWKAIGGRDGVTRTYWQQGERGWQKAG